MNRRDDLRRSRGNWIPKLAHDIGLALCGFGYLLVLIYAVALVGDYMGVFR